jgi:hypothetical protein
MGRPIWVSDSLMDFFLRNTLSPLRETTLNSIFPEKVAVRDLQKQKRAKLESCNTMDLVPIEGDHAELHLFQVFFNC